MAVRFWPETVSQVSTAGMGNPAGILEITEAEFDRTISVNLKSCFNYIRVVAPHMLAGGGGRIASMSSLNAHSGGVTAAFSRFSYAAAKAGILGMTRALAKELGPTILVNAICPGLIQTELTTKNPVIVERGAAIARDGIALHRMGGVEDVAQLVLFWSLRNPASSPDRILRSMNFNITSSRHKAVEQSRRDKWRSWR